MKTLLVFSSIIICSCATAVQYPVIEPPEILIDPGPQEILFVSRFDTAQIDFNKDKKVDVYKQSYTSFINGLSDGFSAIDSIIFNRADTALAGKWYTGKWYTLEIPEFNNNSVVSLLQQYSTNYLLTLDALELHRGQEVEVAENEDGTKSRQAYYDLVLTASLSLFDQYGNVLDKIKVDDQQYIDDRSVISGLFAVGPNVGNFAEVANPMAYDLGFHFASLFSEQEVIVVRQFHTGKVFKEAARLVDKGQWLEAEKILLPIADHSDKKIARRAAENLAIVYEAMGAYEKSKQWQDKAGK